MVPDTNGYWKMNNATKDSSLLYKTLKQFLFCTIVCFILTAPLFYLLTKYFYAEDMIDLIQAVEQGESIPKLDLEKDIIAGMMLQFLLIFTVISLALFITLRFITKKMWQPFDDTLRKAENFNLAQSEIPVFMKTSIFEFNLLNKTLEMLMRKDKEIYQIQKEFTENASHELQTPIAIIRNKLDLLMQENLTENQMMIISDLYSLTVRMGHLNKDLLLLAKIENSQYAVNEKIDVIKLLSESLPLYDSVLNGMKLCITDHRKQRDENITANPNLMECLLKNLIVNAIRYSPAKSNIDIDVMDTGISVTNTSVNSAPLDTRTLFSRFHSGNLQQKGNGLGLAIVKAICDYHHWNITYHFENGNHIFVIDFN